MLGCNRKIGLWYAAGNATTAVTMSLRQPYYKREQDMCDTNPLCQQKIRTMLVRAIKAMAD